MSKKKRPTFKQRLRVGLAEAKTAVRDPNHAWLLVTNALLSTWRSRGGGWYGIGYIVTLLYWEVKLFVQDIAEAGGVVELLTSQLGQLLFRWFSESITNMVLAFTWPVRLLELAGTLPGIALLVLIHYGFEYWLRPLAEARFPELREDREAKTQAKAEKRAAKEQKKEKKRAKRARE